MSGGMLLEDYRDYLRMTDKQAATPWLWVEDLIVEAERANLDSLF